jgi:hypothetical protein
MFLTTSLSVREMGGSGGDRPCWDQAWDSERRDVTEAIVICLEEKEDHLMLYNEVGTAPFPSTAHPIKNLPSKCERKRRKGERGVGARRGFKPAKDLRR